jgi:hypothetical protein
MEPFLSAQHGLGLGVIATIILRIIRIFSAVSP